jgi:hypothetical protein
MGTKKTINNGRLDMKRIAMILACALAAPLLLPQGGWGQRDEFAGEAQKRLAIGRAQLLEARQVAAERGWMIEGVGPDGSGYSLQGLAANGMPQYFVTCNGTAAISTRTDSLWPYVGGGAGERIFMWDQGEPRYTHQEFGGRITWSDVVSPGRNDHSTHVAGTLINSGGFHSPNEPYRGMAYEADLTAYDWNNDLAEMMVEAAGSILLSNHSYSAARGWFFEPIGGDWYWMGDVTISATEDYRFGFYDNRAHTLDSLANAAPHYLIVMSASNDRNEPGTTPPDSHRYWDPVLEDWVWSTATRDIDGGLDGYDCLPNSGQVAKNVLTIGAAVCTYYMPPTYDPQYIEMYSSSSWGPTDDGRIKPDLVGDGANVWSSWGTSDTAYERLHGTSQSAPNVTGSLALLQKAYRDRHGTSMRAATLKALTIGTAVDAGTEGPDYEFGWGLPNFDLARELIEADDADGGIINEYTLSQGDTLYFNFCRPYSGLYKAVFTLCWSDPEATPPSPSLNPTDPMLVNDLDMRVYYDGIEYAPWILNPANPSAPAMYGDNTRDNVERSEFILGDTGKFIVRVTHKGTLMGGSQDFSLIASQVRRTKSYHVYADGSGDFPNIATAAANTECGDTVFVHAGTYNEHDIVFSHEETVIGVDGAENTIINAQDLGRGFLLSGEITLRGFTVMNGTKTGTDFNGRGAGIYCSGEPEVYDCIVKENVANEGGGIYSVHGAKVQDCVIRENTAWDNGGGVFFSSIYYPELIGCLVDGNVSDEAGGGVYSPSNHLRVQNTTIVNNISVSGGAGLHVHGERADIDNAIVAFNMSLGTGVGVHTDQSTIDIVCCDVYGNNAGDYGGGIGDQTGSNDNISADPLFCDAAGDDFTLEQASPCAPANSPCGSLIGAYDAGCGVISNLEIQSAVFTLADPAVGDTIWATVKVRNTGPDATGSFYIDYYEDHSHVPTTGEVGDQRHLVAGLAPGDSVEWTTAPITAACFGDWDSYFQIDTDDAVLESDEGDNTSGPHDVEWQIPSMAGWPVAGSVDFLGSPAIAPLDDNPFTREVVIGDAAGYLHALDHTGDPLPGWPVNVGDSLVSSPAVGDITGDYHMEVVVGCVDGYLYAFDHEGTQLWSHNAGDPMRTTPALADLDHDGKLEVVFANTNFKFGAYVNVLEGNGSTFTGSWPFNIGDPNVTSPAVGDVSRSGNAEIAVVTYGMTTPIPHSDVYLLNRNGTIFSAHWPAQIDTVVVAAPVIGDIATTVGSHLEIVVGGMDGRVYALSSAGGTWPSPPRVAGSIERSPALVNADKEPFVEIVVSSRYWDGSFPPAGRWVGGVTLIDNTGSIMSGWPRGAGNGTMFHDAPMPSPVAMYGRVITGSCYGDIYGWDNNGATTAGFPYDLTGTLSSSVALGDLDGNGFLELVGGTNDAWIGCLDLSCDSAYDADRRLDWAMYRKDRTRCGCYVDDIPSGADDDQVAAPGVTALRSIQPNPFNPTTTVTYEIAAPTRVNIAVFDVAGRRVAVLKDEVVPAGRHRVVWRGTTDSGRIAASGVYFCRLQAAGVIETRKMVLLK